MSLRKFVLFSKVPESVSKNICSFRFGKNYTTDAAPNHGLDEDEFRVLDLKGQSKTVKQVQRQWQESPPLPNRADSMPTDQDWTNVWPAPRSFHPAVVPLPIRQGVNKLGAAPDKFGNAELMKIPNFLHLTPPAIEKHCKALKQFCTEWPEGLETEEKMQKHFPLEVTMTDYCHSAPTIRDPLARIVTIKLPLSHLELNEHAKDKFLRLVGERYDEETGMVTIVADKCPLRKQNYDYALYLLTALYHESWNVEEWEKLKSEADYEHFVWEESVSKSNVETMLEASGRQLDSKTVDDYAESLRGLFDEGENDYNWDKYAIAAEKLIFNTS